MSQPTWIRARIRSSRRAALEPLEARNLLAATWDGGGDGQHWSDPKNWVADGVPQPADDVIIQSPNAFTLQVDVPVPPLSSFRWAAPQATLQVPEQPLFVQGPTEWLAGRVELTHTDWASGTIRVGAQLQINELATLRAAEIVQLNNGQIQGTGRLRIVDASLLASRLDVAIELVNARLNPSQGEPATAAVLQLNRPATLDPTSSIEIELVDTADGVRADQLILGDAAELKGAVQINIVTDALVPLGAQFEILVAPGKLGPGPQLQGTELAPGLILLPRWSETSLVLQAVEPIAADRLEPNDTCASATDLGPGDRTLVGLSLNQPGRDDWFRWTAPARGILAANLFFEHAQGDLDLWVYDAHAQVTEWSATRTDNEHVTLPVVPGSQYCLRVLGFGGDTQPDYDLELHLGPESPRIYVSQGDRIEYLDLEGRPLGTIQLPDLAGAQLSDLELGHGDLLYVAVEGNADNPDRIVELTPNGSLSRVFPVPAELTPGSAAYPLGFEVLEDSSLLVAQPNDGRLIRVARDHSVSVIQTGLAVPSDGTVLTTGEIRTTSMEPAGSRHLNPADNGTAWHVSSVDATVRLIAADGTTLRTIALPPDFLPREADGLRNGHVWVVGSTAANDTQLAEFDAQGQLLRRQSWSGAVGGMVVLPFDRPVRLPQPDEDGDGLPDDWERFGVDLNGDGLIDLDLPSLGANPRRKDLFVEIDAMVGREPLAWAATPAEVTARGLATGTVLDRVVASFLAAPVANPDGSFGVNLHLSIDDVGLPLLPFNTRWNEFDAIKTGHRSDARDGTFGSAADRQDPNWPQIRAARRQVYRYALFADRFGDTLLSGLGELPGDDLIVTLGAWATPGGTADQQAGTFMHELGHTLGLRHGGHDNLNFKPNYQSVMNYHWQSPHVNHSGWRLDYSREELPALDELQLDESRGIGSSTPAEVPVGPLPLQVVPLSGPIDWDRDGVTTFVRRVEADINRGFADVNGDGLVNLLDDSPGEYLSGSDDWTRLRYHFTDLQNFRDYGDGDKDRPEDADSDPTDLYDDHPPDFLDRGASDNDTPTKAYCLDPLESLFGLTIDNALDVDWFKWLADTSGDLRIALDADGSFGRQLELSIWDESFQPLDQLVNDVDDGYEEIRVTVQLGKTYYFQVDGGTQGDFGNYDLLFQPGDFNADQVVDLLDIAALCAHFGNAPEYDLDGDQWADPRDLDVLVTEILGTDKGDANLDGRFDSADLILVFQAGEYEDALAGNSSWASGDWNCDGEFDSGDLVVAFQGGGYVAQATRTARRWRWI